MLVLILLCSFSTRCCRATTPREVEREENNGCKTIAEEILLADRTTIVDDTPSRLRSTWLSQECEVRPGPEYVIRKYTFFENSTFLLLRHHYSEESCSAATHTVIARGAIRISSPSVLILGATEAEFRLDTVRVIPLDRQIARKFARRANASCGVETKWRPYVPGLVYDRYARYAEFSSFSPHGPSRNSFRSRSERKEKHPLPPPPDCLDGLGIDFSELRLIRVQRRGSTAVELLLGELVRRRRMTAIGPIGPIRPTKLQAGQLLRADTIAGCLICGSVLRSTEYSPPILHQLPSLPAVVYGLWLSGRCESVEGGFWSRRLLRIRSMAGRWAARWTARWDYYADSGCSRHLYANKAAGSYVQRCVDRHLQACRDRKGQTFGSGVDRHDFRHSDTSRSRSFAESRRDRDRKNLEDLLESIPRRAFPSGTIELELRVLESRLILVDETISLRCGGRGTNGGGRSESAARAIVLASWSKNCVPRAIEAPSTLIARARVVLDWNEGYRLLLTSWDDDRWEAPLSRCTAPIHPDYPPSKNRPRDKHSSMQRDPFQYIGENDPFFCSDSLDVPTPTPFLLLLALLHHLLDRCF